MKYFLLLLSVLTFGFSAMSQPDNYLRHKVAPKETVTQIAQKYRITPYEIYRLNPDARAGLREGEFLLIPRSREANPEMHEVAAGETLYGVARRYNITVEALTQANRDALKEGLKPGQQLRIPGGSSQAGSAAQPVVPKPMAHVVEPGQTRYSIAKMYRISIAELERQNPEIKDGLRTGQTLYIISETRSSSPGDAPVARPEPKVYEIQGSEVVSVTTQKTVTRSNFATHEVKPKETLFSLSQQYSVTQEELLQHNPELAEGLKIGMKLKIPARSSMRLETTGEFRDLTATLNTSQRKEMVLLLPFNAARMPVDSASAVADKLKKDVFLNMTLDFYSGALMAIDSAKTLGLNVSVKILDSRENRNSSAVEELIRTHQLGKADVIIGPFYQQHAETTAQLLANEPATVISPLSKERVQSLVNLYQAMPSDRFTKRTMLNFMRNKNGNIIVLSDPKRNATKELITAEYPEVRFVSVDASGNFTAEALKSMLVKDRTNYLVLDTEKTGMILAATNVLMAESANFPVQLAILESNDTLEYDEISLKRLTLLKLLFPSVTRENNSPGAMAFRNSYRHKNKGNPSQYATRGFDITFDTLLRLSQGTSFAESARNDRTEHVEGKFDYRQKDEQGYINQGVYVLQYNDDLTITEAQ